MGTVGPAVKKKWADITEEEELAGAELGSNNVIRIVAEPRSSGAVVQDAAAIATALGYQKAKTARARTGGTLRAQLQVLQRKLKYNWDTFFIQTLQARISKLILLPIKDNRTFV